MRVDRSQYSFISTMLDAAAGRDGASAATGSFFSPVKSAASGELASLIQFGARKAGAELARPMVQRYVEKVKTSEELLDRVGFRANTFATLLKAQENNSVSGNPANTTAPQSTEISSASPATAVETTATKAPPDEQIAASTGKPSQSVSKDAVKADSNKDGLNTLVTAVLTSKTKKVSSEEQMIVSASKRSRSLSEHTAKTESNKASLKSRATAVLTSVAKKVSSEEQKVVSGSKPKSVIDSR